MIDITNMPTYLSHDELVNITGKKRHKQICEQLDRWGFQYETRLDGSAVVSRLYYEERMGVKIVNGQRKKPKLNLQYA